MPYVPGPLTRPSVSRREILLKLLFFYTFSLTRYRIPAVILPLR
jgi:hypothetical protein